jgi:hypothetical protein
LAAELAGTAVVLQATVDRRWLKRFGRALAKIPGVPSYVGAQRLREGFGDPTHITHRIDVRDFTARKRMALAAHRSQQTGGNDLRTAALLLRLPRPLFRAALGREWFIESGRPAGRPCGDIFDSLHSASGHRPQVVIGAAAS